MISSPKPGGTPLSLDSWRVGNHLLTGESHIRTSVRDIATIPTDKIHQPMAHEAAQALCDAHNALLHENAILHSALAAHIGAEGVELLLKSFSQPQKEVGL